MIYDSTLHAAYEELRRRVPQADSVSVDVTARMNQSGTVQISWFAHTWRAGQVLTSIGDTASKAINKAVEAVEKHEQSILEHATRIRARLSPAPEPADDQAAELREQAQQQAEDFRNSYEQRLHR